MCCKAWRHYRFVEIEFVVGKSCRRCYCKQLALVGDTTTKTRPGPLTLTYWIRMFVSRRSFTVICFWHHLHINLFKLFNPIEHWLYVKVMRCESSYLLDIFWGKCSKHGHKLNAVQLRNRHFKYKTIVLSICLIKGYLFFKKTVCYNFFSNTTQPGWDGQRPESPENSQKIY